MSKCRGGQGWRSCGAQELYVRSAFSGGNIEIDAEPSTLGDVIIRDGLAHVLSRDEAAAHPGPRHTVHLTTCREAVAALNVPLYRGGAHQTTRLRPAFESGTFDTPSAAAAAAIEIGALEQESERMAAKFVEHLVETRGEQDVYDYAEVNQTFNSFRRLYGIRPAVCEGMKQFIRRRIYISEAEAA